MKKQKNSMDFVPIKNSAFKYYTNDKNLIVVEVIRNGVFDKIAQKVFKVPKKSNIELDELGSFIWNLIDGKRTIYDISVLVKEQFKDKCEPLYERLVKYFVILNDNKFITYK